jgi:hypothetical protein
MRNAVGLAISSGDINYDEPDVHNALRVHSQGKPLKDQLAEAQRILRNFTTGRLKNEPEAPERRRKMAALVESIQSKLEVRLQPAKLQAPKKKKKLKRRV